MICKCKYCGREFEATRPDASTCPSRECRNARWRSYGYHKRIKPPPVYLLECRVCSKKFKSTTKMTLYCSEHCRKVAKGHYYPKSSTGIAETDTKLIASRRREVYARMQQFASLDGNRK